MDADDFEGDLELSIAESTPVGVDTTRRGEFCAFTGIAGVLVLTADEDDDSLDVEGFLFSLFHIGLAATFGLLVPFRNSSP